MNVRLADDWAEVGRLLHAFNGEFDEPSPGAEFLARRLPELADTRVLVVGEPAHGIAVLRIRTAYWADGAEAYLADLYVEPGHRGHGDGRALLEAAVELARAEGAAWIELNTDPDDHAAHALYKSNGFERTAHYYEREL